MLSTTNYLLLRYQSNALLFAESNTPFTSDSREWFRGADIIVGRFQATYWLKEFNTIGIWTNRHRPEEVGNRVEYAYLDARDLEVRRLLQLGCTMASLSGAHWAGASWLATNHTLGTWMLGRLLHDETGRPRGMVVEERAVGQRPAISPKRRWRYNYSYAHRLALDYLPSEVMTIPGAGVSPELWSRLRYVRVRVAQKPLEEEYFAIMPDLLRQAQYRYVISNRFRVYSTRAGVRVVPDHRPPPSRVSLVWVKSVWMAVVAVIVLSPVVLWRKYTRRARGCSPQTDKLSRSKIWLG